MQAERATRCAACRWLLAAACQPLSSCLLASHSQSTPDCPHLHSLMVTRSADLEPASGFLRQLCFFAQPAEAADVRLLAAACRLVLAAHVPGTTDVQLLLCSHAAGSGERAAAALQQAQQLVALGLAALARHAPQLEAQLQQPRLGAAAAATAPTGSVAAPILEAVVLLTAADSWTPALGPAAAADATAQVLAAAVRRGLFAQLAAVGAAACPEDRTPAAPAAGEPAPAARQAVPAGEALVTALTARYLGQQQAVAMRLEQHVQRRQQAAPPSQPGQQAAAAPPAPTQQQELAASAERQLPMLLCVPLVLRRLPTLRHLAPRLWRPTVASLHSLSPAELTAWLRAAGGASPGAAALAGAALLGNLLDGAEAALRADNAAALAAARLPALQVAALASTLLALLPLQPFFPSSDGDGGSSSGGAASRSGRWTGEGEDEDEDSEAVAARAAAAAAAAAQTPRLPWDAEQLPSAGLVAQLQQVSSGRVLRALVRALLPAASATDQPPAPAVSLQQRAGDARRLCTLLQQLAALPGQRQRLPAVLAFSAELVQRMWFSYLRPAQATPRECGHTRGFELTGRGCV